MEIIVALVIAYLIGSINSAILICKYLKFGDPRKVGSSNPGATNVLRVAGKNAAIATLLGDAAKGFIAVLIARLLGQHGFELGLVAVAVFLGHVYPVFFKFKGGKGVATALGAMLCLHALLGITVIVIWIAVAFAFRYSSLAAMIAIGASPILSLVFSDPQYFLPLLAMTLCLLYNHRENISRLREGKEKRIKFKKEELIDTVKDMAQEVKMPHVEEPDEQQKTEDKPKK